MLQIPGNRRTYAHRSGEPSSGPRRAATPLGTPLAVASWSPGRAMGPSPPWLPPLIAATPPWLPGVALALLATLLLPRGADWPAQLFRVELFRQEGLAPWNGQWYSGHPTPGYGVLFPPLAAAVGAAVVGVGSVLIASICFHEIAKRAFGFDVRLASFLFAIGLVPNLIVGRITFGLGLAVGLAGLLALQRHRWLAAAGLALATPLASPVAGVFLALALGTWSVSALVVGDRRAALLRAAFAGVALAPIALVALMFPSSGSFEFRPYDVALVMMAGLVVLVAARQISNRPLVIGAIIYVAASLVVFAIPNPLGGNVVRLAMFFAAPLAIVLLRPIGFRPVAPLVALGLVWTWTPAVVTLAAAQGDPSLSPDFHEPLVRAIKGAPGPPGRVEIPFTQNHWETLYVASDLPIARGWERQADRSLNELFYEPTLSEREYRRWLHENAVRWIALPAVDLDPSSRAEAALLLSRPTWLREFWANGDWQLWEVVDPTPIVAAPGQLLRLTPAGVAFWMSRRGSVAVRVHYSRHWGVAAGAGCIEKSANGMMRVTVAAPGLVELQQRLFSSSGC
jgi:hypothetical protein